MTNPFQSHSLYIKAMLFVTHSSHKLKIFNGLIYCSKCGSRDSWRGFVALAKPCRPPARHGAVSLAALRDGRLPPNVQSWPTEKKIDRPLRPSLQILLLVSGLSAIGAISTCLFLLLCQRTRGQCLLMSLLPLIILPRLFYPHLYKGWLTCLSLLKLVSLSFGLMVFLRMRPLP